MGIEIACSTCQGFHGCSGCYVCQSCLDCNNDCLTCQSCNSCEKCVECEGTCDTLQAFCTIGCQTYGEYGTFYFSYRPTPGVGRMGPGYFDQTVWDQIITHINQMLAKGTKQNSGSPMAYSLTQNVAPFTAAEFNRVAAAAGAGQPATKGGLIYGSYFTDLETAVNNIQQLSGNACDTCNIKCDVVCDSCQMCNTQNSDPCSSGQGCGAAQTAYEWINGICNQAVCCGCETACEASSNVDPDPEPETPCKLGLTCLTNIIM